MAIITDRFLAPHIPKTGGTWLAGVIQELHAQLRLKYVKIGHGHSYHPDTDEDREVFIVVRHPVAWLRSIWMHVKRNGGQADFRPMPMANRFVELARNADNLRLFVNQVANEGTMVSDAWGAYMRAYPQHFILPLEDINPQLTEFFRFFEISKSSHSVMQVLSCQAHQIGRSSGAVPRIIASMNEKMRVADPLAYEIWWHSFEMDD